VTVWRAAPLALVILSAAAPARAQFNPFNPFGAAGGAGQNAGTSGAGGNSGASGNNNRGNATEQQLRRSEQDDSGRGLEWFYLSAGGGAEYVNLTALSQSGDLLPGKQTSGAAPSGSVALGARLLTLTIGARARVDFLSDYKLLTVDPEIGLHLPSGDLEPYFLLGGGYSRLLGLTGATSSKSVGGYNLRLAGGVDYYLNKYVSIGGQVNVEMIHLGRDAYPRPEGGVNDLPPGAYASASATGIAVGGALLLGLHL
jgi:hypothetical protein